MKSFVSLWMVLCLPFFGFSQSYYDSLFTGDGNTFRERKVVPWPDLQSGNVMMVKRVERIIDVRQKQNQPMAWPVKPLSSILYDAVMSNMLIAYETDEMRSSMTIEEFVRLGNDTEYVESLVSPEDPSFTQIDTVILAFAPNERIQRYRIVEDWIYDKRRSQYFVRIISIAPQFEWKMGGVGLGWKDLCVLKYASSDGKDVRHVLVKHRVFNRQNNVSQLSFDDWFEQRLFSSFIIKISNPWNSYVRDEAEFKDNSQEALLEAERLDRLLHEKEENLYED